MTILALDTSTNRGTIALTRGGSVAFEEFFAADRSQSSQLFPLLAKAVGTEKRLDAIAIGLGPGSYAGTRIAIAAALGLAEATGAQLLGLPSVAALETDASEYLAIGDARRDTFYFSRIKDGVCAEGPLLLGLPSLQARLESWPALPAFSSAPIPNLPQVATALPTARKLAALAGEGRSIVQRGDLEPLYLRDPHITKPKARQP